MALHIQPRIPQPNLLLRKQTEGDEPPLIKLTTFGSQGSSGVEVPLFVSPGRQVTESERSRVEKKVEEVKRKESILQSQPTAGFPDNHGRRKQPEGVIDSESSFTLGTDLSEREAVDKTDEERLPPVEDSVNMRKTALLRLATLDREEYDLVHRCCRRLQKGIFAVVSVYQDTDWWILRLSDLGGLDKCEAVLEPNHPWQKHSPVELASLIELDSEDHLVLPTQRLDLFVPKDSEQSLSSNASERRKSATFGPKKEATRKKVMGGVEYELAVELKLRGTKTELSVSATPATGQGAPFERQFTSVEMAEASLSVELTDIEKVADAVVYRLQLTQGNLRLYPPISRRESVTSLIPEISGISYQTSRVLNDGQRYVITFSSIPLDSGTEKTIYVDAQPEDQSKPLEKQLEIEEDELRSLVDYPEGDLLSDHLEAAADLLIIENGNELHLGRRQLPSKKGSEAPVIHISLTDSDNLLTSSHAPAPLPTAASPSQRRAAACTIQRYWKARLAREHRLFAAKRKQRLLRVRAGVLSEFALISGLQEKGRKWLVSESLASEGSTRKEVEGADFPNLREVFTAEQTSVALILQKIHRGTVARQQTELAKQYSKRVPACTRLLTSEGRKFATSVFNTDIGVLVEAAPLQTRYKGEMVKAHFDKKQLEKFGKPLNLELFMQQLKLEKDKFELKAQEETVFSGEVRKLGNTYWVEATVETSRWREAQMHFQVQGGLQTSRAVKDLLAWLGPVNSAEEAARMTVTHLLTVRKGSVQITPCSPPVLPLVTRLQAVARGYLLRKQQASKQVKPTRMFTFSSSPSLQLPPEVSETSDIQQKRSRLRMVTIAPTSIVSQPPSPLESSPIHSRTLKRFESINVSDTEDPPFEIRLPTPKIQERKPRRVLNKRTRSAAASSVTQRRPKSCDVLFLPIYESARNELVTKTGVDVSGLHCVAAVFRTPQGASIEVVVSSTREKFKLTVAGNLPSEQQEAEIAAAALISRLRLRKSKGGLTLELRASAPQVIYKRSHYISERYMVVTVLDLGSSVELQAADPVTHRCLQLNLGRIKALSAEQLYRQICVLVTRLRVEQVLGEEVLILAQ